MIAKAYWLPALILLLLTAGAAAAQDPTLSDWEISAGAAVILSPRYPGADERRLLVVPAWDVEYRKKWFSKGLDFAGVYLLNEGAWTGGAALSWTFDSRDESDAPHLEGLGDVDSTMRAKLFAEWRRSLLSLKFGAAQDILGRGHGLAADFDARVAVPFFPPWFFTAGPGLTWIDGEHAATFFGVSEEHAVRSGLTPHSAGSGVRDIHLNALAARPLRGPWSAAAIISMRRLVGDAAESPLTKSDTELSLLFTVTRKIR